MITTDTCDKRKAAERHCDLMRQGFMRGQKVEPYTAEQIRAAAEYGARIAAKLDAVAKAQGRS